MPERSAITMSVTAPNERAQQNRFIRFMQIMEAAGLVGAMWMSARRS
jgi:hypothetical protein